MRSCKVIVVPSQNNEQFVSYIDNYQDKEWNNDLYRHYTSNITMVVVNHNDKQFYKNNKIFPTLAINNAHKHNNWPLKVCIKPIYYYQISRGSFWII